MCIITIPYCNTSNEYSVWRLYTKMTVYYYFLGWNKSTRSHEYWCLNSSARVTCNIYFVACFFPLPKNSLDMTRTNFSGKYAPALVNADRIRGWLRTLQFYKERIRERILSARWAYRFSISSRYIGTCILWKHRGKRGGSE